MGTTMVPTGHPRTARVRPDGVTVLSFHVAGAQTETCGWPIARAPADRHAIGSGLHEGLREPLVQAPVSQAGCAALSHCAAEVQVVQNGGRGAA